MILQFPLVKITFFVILGMLSQSVVQVAVEITLATSCTLLLVFGLFPQIPKISSFNSLLVYPLFFCIGLSAAILDIEHTRPSHYTHLLHGKQQDPWLLVTLSKRLKNGRNTVKYIAEVEELNGKRATGKVLLNFYSATCSEMMIGQQLILNARLPNTQPPPNPGQFDYNKFLLRKNIYRQLYLGPDDYKRTGIVRKDIFYYADKVRGRIIRKLRSQNFKEEELQVINALILGQQQELTREISTSYQNAGAVHILSVSGLHVGLILLFINSSLKLMRWLNNRKFIRLSIILSSLWIYAFIAGLSPSVVRSCTMFSLIAVGMAIHRTTNIFHTLITSMLLILLFEPEFLYEVGFQLSYLAVASILWFQPLFSKIWIPEFPIVKYFWDIFTVSLAAQIGTLPLCLFYFHQFPGLFFVTNLLVIPLVTLIMFLGLILLCGVAIGIYHQWPLEFLELMVSILNRIVKTIGAHENFVLTSVPFNAELMLISFLLIITCFLMAMKFNFKNAAVFLLSIILFQAIVLKNLYEGVSSKHLYILNQHKSSALVLCQSGKASVYAKENVEKAEASLKSLSTSSFLTIGTTRPLPDLLYFNNKKIIVIDTAHIVMNIDPDIIVLASSAKINLDRILRAYHPEIVIADGSHYKSAVERWSSTCLQRKIPFHYTGEKGFYTIK